MEGHLHESVLLTVKQQQSMPLQRRRSGEAQELDRQYGSTTSDAVTGRVEIQQCSPAGYF